MKILETERGEKIWDPGWKALTNRRARYTFESDPIRREKEARNL